MKYSEKDLKYRKTIAFFTSALITFVVIGVLFYMIGFVPYYVDGTEANTDFSTRLVKLSQYGFDSESIVALSSLPQLGEEASTDRSSVESAKSTVIAEPERILINGVDIDLPVLNPESTNIAVLDEALLHGTVRYPGSARLGEDGNLFIFGHSSGLPVVRNQMFKAFNRLPELEEGDVITVIGGGFEYVYRVTAIRLTDVDEALVDLSQKNRKKLTISTCNSFGAKSERWVVEADFVGSYESNV
ncbi:hypothetical protein COU13_00980 [Candidatus Kaiserbacteria bacterium CG10_big_fil_rev_8_21_14_0_10_43_70]|uniref:Sortase n=1 Tax=Candidatus Kaiserbacteria bacterium CG10_big_fil_rev_8_21_14_0_10_43_70 TaxID=1974605 RepID=A0A2H0UKX6_9BACT|nr:MAG: hypothetical protein COU13_00980 [Candidatus Kaiserbacteria bacterium CG10_big_fil_rev_8_21_14_0_10_43_70]